MVSRFLFSVYSKCGVYKEAEYEVNGFSMRIAAVKLTVFASSANFISLLASTL